MTEGYPCFPISHLSNDGDKVVVARYVQFVHEQKKDSWYVVQIMLNKELPGRIE